MPPNRVIGSAVVAGASEHDVPGDHERDEDHDEDDRGDPDAGGGVGSGSPAVARSVPGRGGGFEFHALMIPQPDYG